MTRARLLLEGGHVLVEKDHFAHMSLLTENGKIKALVPAGEGPSDAGRVDVGNRLIMPGLVNGRTHSHGALGRGGVPDDLPLEAF